MKIGLALSGGGTRGFAHVGVLQVLVENGIKIDLVAGTSAGSIAGGAFAAGMTLDEIAAMSSRVRWSNSVRPSLSPLGLLSNAPMGAFIRREFPVTTFEEMSIPFAAVSYDLAAGEEVVHSTGDLAFAIRASCAVPGVFAPLRNDRHQLLVDGGVVSPLPVEAARKMGADRIIAVDLNACGATFRQQPRTAVGMMFEAAMTLIRTASQRQSREADVVIEPQLAHLRPDDIKSRDECLRLGREAAESSLGTILTALG